MHIGHFQLINKPFPLSSVNLLGYVLAGLCILILPVAWLLIYHAYPFLAKHDPISDPDAVVVEAWLPYYALKALQEDLTSHPTTQLIVVGGKFDHDYFTMGHQPDPSLEFYLNKCDEDSGPVDTLSILASGAFAHDEWGMMEIWINGIQVGICTTSDKPTYYHFILPDTVKIPMSVKLVMPNTYLKEAGPKREVRIHQLEVGNKIFSPFSSSVIYGFTNLDGIYTENTLHSQTSGFTTCLLEEMGISRTRIISLTRSLTSGSRTLNNAKQVANWLTSSSSTIRSVNVYSQAAHARRSFEMYRKTIGSKKELGVVALPNKHYDSQWWKTPKGRMYMTEQIIKYLASKLVGW